MQTERQKNYQDNMLKSRLQPSFFDDSARIVCWFSCGAASAVACKLAVEKYGERAVIVNCDTTDDEHPDNKRFRKDVEKWIGVEILEIRSTKYKNVDDVIEKTGYMSGVGGARCTTELKKLPRREFECFDDIHIFGYTLEEKKRAETFELNNFELNLEWILIENGLTKNDCYEFLKLANIKRSEMYDLGFDNANCIGCLKAQSPKYWNLVRKLFPIVFAKRCEQSRRLNVRLVKYKGQRIFLDELPMDANEDLQEQIECGVLCQTGTQDVAIKT